MKRRTSVGLFGLLVLVAGGLLGCATITDTDVDEFRGAVVEANEIYSRSLVNGDVERFLSIQRVGNYRQTDTRHCLSRPIHCSTMLAIASPMAPRFESGQKNRSFWNRQSSSQSRPLFSKPWTEHWHSR